MITIDRNFDAKKSVVELAGIAKAPDARCDRIA
jgi:hypothetical protein